MPPTQQGGNNVRRAGSFEHLDRTRSDRTHGQTDEAGRMRQRLQGAGGSAGEVRLSWSRYGSGNRNMPRSNGCHGYGEAECDNRIGVSAHPQQQDRCDDGGEYGVA